MVIRMQRVEIKKVYQYPVKRSQWIVGPLVSGLLGILAVMLFVTGSNGKTLSDQMVSIALGLLLLWLPLLWLLHVLGVIKVITSDRGLVIKNLFKTRSISWVQITEFGTYRTIGYLQYFTVFYLKANGFGDRKIQVCLASIQNLDALLDDVFRQAINARFLRIKNRGMIPFSRKIETVPWTRDRD
jgi:hypothetical protein